MRKPLRGSVFAEYAVVLAASIAVWLGAIEIVDALAKNEATFMEWLAEP